MFLSLYVCFTLIFLVFCSSVCPNLFLRLSLETLLYPFLIFSVCLCFFTCGFLSGITNTEVEVKLEERTLNQEDLVVPVV